MEKKEDKPDPCPKCRTLKHDNCHSMHCPMRIQDDNEELTLQIQVANTGNQILESQLSLLTEENKRLMSKVDDANDLLKECHRCAYYGQDLKDDEVLKFHLTVWTGLKEEIEAFLEDK